MSLNLKAWLGVSFLAVVMGLCIFVPAGTVHYWQGWLFLAVFFAASFLPTLYGMKHDPALVRRRLAGGLIAEKETTQKIIMLFISIGFAGLLVVPVLDHRFGWSRASFAAAIAGNVLIVVGFFITALAFRANTFASATIEVTADQRVITTGPYALVRHPQYAGAFLYLFGIPLALGSYWGLLVFAGMTPFLLWRLCDEEKVLEKELPGYVQYRRRVRSRLIPGIY